MTETSLAGLKIIVGVNNGRGQVGIQGKDTDPMVFPLKGETLREMMDPEQISACIAQAQERWLTAPKNAKYERPAPPPPAPSKKTEGKVVPGSVTRTVTQRVEPKKPPQLEQKTMF